MLLSNYCPLTSCLYFSLSLPPPPPLLFHSLSLPPGSNRPISGGLAVHYVQQSRRPILLPRLQVLQVLLPLMLAVAALHRRIPMSQAAHPYLEIKECLIQEGGGGETPTADQPNGNETQLDSWIWYLLSLTHYFHRVYTYLLRFLWEEYILVSPRHCIYHWHLYPSLRILEYAQVTSTESIV